MCIESVMLSNDCILCYPLLLLPSIFWLFFSELALHIRWPKYWSFSFSNRPSNDYSGFISFRTDLFDLLVDSMIYYFKPIVTYCSEKKKFFNNSLCFPDVHPYGRKWRETKKPLDEGERGEWKGWLKTQHSENEDHGIWSHHFMANRWENNGNSDRLYFLELQKSLQMVTASMKSKDSGSLEENLWPN